MNSRQVDLRYSKALFNLGGSIEKRKKHLGEFELILGTLSNSPRIKNFFSSSQIDRNEKEKVLKKAFSIHVSPEVLRFLIFLLERGRFRFLEPIIEEFRRKVIEDEDIIVVRLMTTLPTDDVTKEKLRSKIERRYGKKVDIIQEIDPKLIGGGVLFVANQMIDFSVKGKLNRLKDDLLAVNI